MATNLSGLNNFQKRIKKLSNAINNANLISTVAEKGVQIATDATGSVQDFEDSAKNKNSEFFSLVYFINSFQNDGGFNPATSALIPSAFM